MSRAQVISQQNTQTESQNVVAMCHIKKYFLKLHKNWKYRKYLIFSNGNIRYISMIYIGDIYQANRARYSSQGASTTDVAWLVHGKQPASHVPCRRSKATSSELTGLLWYLTGQKWSLCYPKVHANRVRVIRRHLCIKPRTFDRAKTNLSA